MAVKTKISEKEGIYFITFTCLQWLPLLQLSNCYDAVYKWFDYLKIKGHFVTGYVIMPNHVHTLIAFRAIGSTNINTIVSNGKRFLAYEIVKRLKDNNRNDLLNQLAGAVTTADKKRGKLHQVFEPSFDAKECRNDKFIEQKLSYMHDNPCKGVWNLAISPIDYSYSSARFYYAGVQAIYEVKNYKELNDIDLTKPV